LKIHLMVWGIDQPALVLDLLLQLGNNLFSSTLKDRYLPVLQHPIVVLGEHDGAGLGRFDDTLPGPGVHPVAVQHVEVPAERQLDTAIEGSSLAKSA